MEISCHGSISVINKITKTLLKKQIRLAEPGEFTKRALMNDKVSVLEAETINDLVNAETENQRNSNHHSLRCPKGKQFHCTEPRIHSIGMGINFPITKEAASSSRITRIRSIRSRRSHGIECCQRHLRLS